MSTIALTAYVLVWPVIVGGTLYAICRAFFRELIEAKRAGKQIV